MKLIKLDRRHNLYHKGYQYAFVFTKYGHNVPCSNTVHRLVCRTEDIKWHETNTFYGKREKYQTRTPYYVGFRNESTATLVRLQL